MSRLPFLLSIALALTLMACQPATHDGASIEDETARITLPAESATLGEEPATSTDMEGAPCNADSVQALIGQHADEDVVTQALKDSGAKVRRVLGPTDAATLDLSPSRLNIITDANGIIQTLHCG